MGAVGIEPLRTDTNFPGIVAIAFADRIGAPPAQVGAVLDINRYLATITLYPGKSNTESMLPRNLADALVPSVLNEIVVVKYSGIVLAFCMESPCTTTSTSTTTGFTMPRTISSTTTLSLSDESMVESNANQSKETTASSSGKYILISVAITVTIILVVLTYKRRRSRKLERESTRDLGMTTMQNVIMMDDLQKKPNQVHAKNSSSLLNNVAVNAAMTETEFEQVMISMQAEGDVLEFNSVMHERASQQVQLQAAAVAQKTSAWASNSLADDFDDYEL
jgi:hypothetical protein